jgi:streptogramin lyase
VAAGAIDGGGNSVTLGCNAHLTAVIVTRDAFRAGHHLNIGGAIAAAQIFLGPDTQAALAGGFSCNDAGGCGPADACSSFSCVAGQCLRSSAPDGTTCGAGDACSRLSCLAGQCQRSSVPDGTACDDQNVCTSGDRCQTGACAPGPSIVTRYSTGLAQATALTPGPDGNLWFISPESQPGAFDGRVARIVPATGAVDVFPTARRLLDIKAGPDGNLWLAERLPAPGGELSALGRLTPGGLFLDELLGLPADKIAAGPDGNQWFVSAVGDANLAGGIRPVDGLLIAILFVTNTARHMIGGPDGNVWVTESNGGVGPALIGRIAPDSRLTEFAVQSSGDLNVIAAGPDGNLWFTDEGENQIGRITPAGVITKFPLPIAGSAPHGIATGPDGTLWFTERDSNRIGRITVDGSVTELACLPTATGRPTSIAAGADGRLWLTESATGNVVGIRIP